MSDDIKINLNQIKKLWDEDRFKTLKSGYKLDKRIFNIGMFLIFFWLFFIAYHYDFKLNYYECIGDNRSILPQNCTNPFYKPMTWENYKTLPVGTYGQKPTTLFYSSYWVTILIFIFCIVLNHLSHNKKIGVNMEKKIKIQAITNKGKKALEQHIEETKKLGFKQKLIFKAAGYSQAVICHNPVIIQLTINNKHAEKDKFMDLIIDEITTALEENGAIKEKDYKVTIQ